MKSLAIWFTNKIQEQILQRATNKVLVCLNSIDDAEIYCDICVALQSYADKHGIRMTAKLSKKKFEDFLKKPDAAPYARTMQNNNWVDFDDKMTYYRNLLPEQSDETHLVLLMGTEAVKDRGGLADFYTLNPQKADRQIKIIIIN